MFATESWIPKPVSTSAVQPAMPRIIIIMRFLKRKMLRRETLCRNFRRFHSGVMRSRKMRFPAAGVFGRMRFAGMFCISMRRAKYVVPAEHKSDAASAMTNSAGSYSMTKPGMRYSMP